jgi:hypothetical protein
MSTTPHAWIDQFYAGLKELDKSTFPKTCNSCGKIYETPSAFIEDTNAVANQSGLAAYADDAGPFVGLFRDCSCKSTLLGTFKDRRDNSPRGVNMREKFEVMLKLLDAKGIEKNTARVELLKVLKGGESELLVTLGVDIRSL